MKAVILGNTKLNYSWFVKTYRQGLKLNGVDVLEIDYRSTPLQEIRKNILEYKPNFIFTHLSFHPQIHPPEVSLDFFKGIKDNIDTKVIHICNDARENDRYMGDLRGSFDASFHGSYPMVENCAKAFKIPTFYSPYSTLTYKEMGKFTSDLDFNVPVFTGNVGIHRIGWKDNRAGFIESLNKIMPMKIFQTQSANDLRERTLELSASAKCILGLCVGYEIDGYMDVRPFQYLGAGAFMIMRKFSSMDRYIPEDLYAPFYSYDDPKVVKDLWEYWKDKDTTEIRKKAFKYVQEKHSSKQRIGEVLYELNQL